MGLIMAAAQAIGNTLKDQWLEYFICPSLPPETLMVQGQKMTKGNNKGNDNVITNGSGIVVADGQCMIIVEQGRVMEICAEPGEYTYDIGSQPSVFSGKFGAGLVASFKQGWNDFKHGGDKAVDQRVYYFNTKEIMGNLFGTQNPIPFRIVDRNIGLDLDSSLRCNGTYTFHIADPMMLYQYAIGGNFSGAFAKSTNGLDTQMRSEFLKALQPALGKLSAQGIRYSELPAHTDELCDELNEALADLWRGKRGIEIGEVVINSATIPPEDHEMIKQAQRAAINRDPSMAAATMVGAQAQAMQDAAKNIGGAVNAFMGMGMAQNMGGVNASQLFAMGQGQQAAPAAPAAAAPAANSWTCSCGTVNSGKFCMSCGSAKPAPAEGWTCSCGTVNQGKFCMECGKSKPAGAPLYRCDKCGWQQEDPMNPPKFCPECGDLFDENDVQK